MPSKPSFSHVTLTAPNRKAFEKTLDFFNVLGFRTISYTNKSTNNLEPVTIKANADKTDVAQKQDCRQSSDDINEAWLHLFTPGGHTSGVTLHINLARDANDEERNEAWLEKIMEKHAQLKRGEFDQTKQMCFSFTVDDVADAAEKLGSIKIPYFLREGHEGHKTVYCYDSLGTLLAFTDRPLPFARNIEAGLDSNLPPLTYVCSIGGLTAGKNRSKGSCWTEKKANWYLDERW